MELLNLVVNYHIYYITGNINEKLFYNIFQSISMFDFFSTSNSHDKNCDFEKKVCNKLNARESTLTLLTTVVNKSLELISIGAEKIKKDPLVFKYLGESAIVNVLLPLVLAHIGPLTSFSKDAKVSIYIL